LLVKIKSIFKNQSLIRNLNLKKWFPIKYFQYFRLRNNFFKIYN
jgi:hypothetical protein